MINTNSLKQIIHSDIRQSMRSRWFWAYSLLFGGFVAVMFASGITESQIIGFVGLSRLMVTFMQISMAILPIYVLISTVRSVVGDRENSVMEYMLSLPISFSSYFWGKLIGRFLLIYVPIFIALLGAVLWAMITKVDVPWDLFILYSILLASLVFFFLGLSMYISAKAKNQEIAVSTAFIIWLFLVAFIDLILIGIMLRMRGNPDLIIVSGTRLIKEKMLSIKPKLGILNLHTGLSPYIKGGPNCTNWCIATKQFHLIGNTIMWIDLGIDTGNIVTTEFTNIDSSDNLLDIHIKVMEHAHSLYLKAIDFLSKGNMSSVKQSEIAKGKTYYTKDWTLKQKFLLVKNLKLYKKMLQSNKIEEYKKQIKTVSID